VVIDNCMPLCKYGECDDWIDGLKTSVSFVQMVSITLRFIAIALPEHCSFFYLEAILSLAYIIREFVKSESWFQRLVQDSPMLR